MLECGCWHPLVVCGCSVVHSCCSAAARACMLARATLRSLHWAIHCCTLCPILRPFCCMLDAVSGAELFLTLPGAAGMVGCAGDTPGSSTEWWWVGEHRILVRESAALLLHCYLALLIHLVYIFTCTVQLWLVCILVAGCILGGCMHRTVSTSPAPLPSEVQCRLKIGASICVQSLSCISQGVSRSSLHWSRH